MSKRAIKSSKTSEKWQFMVRDTHYSSNIFGLPHKLMKIFGTIETEKDVIIQTIRDKDHRYYCLVSFTNKKYHLLASNLILEKCSMLVLRNLDNYSDFEEIKIIRVTGKLLKKSNASASIAWAIRNGKTTLVIAAGLNAVNNMMKVLAIARTLLASCNNPKTISSEKSTIDQPEIGKKKVLDFVFYITEIDYNRNAYCVELQPCNRKKNTEEMQYLERQYLENHTGATRIAANKENDTTYDITKKIRKIAEHIDCQIRKNGIIMLTAMGPHAMLKLVQVIIRLLKLVDESICNITMQSSMFTVHEHGPEKSAVEIIISSEMIWKYNSESVSDDLRAKKIQVIKSFAEEQKHSHHSPPKKKCEEDQLLDWCIVNNSHRVRSHHFPPKREYRSHHFPPKREYRSHHFPPDQDYHSDTYRFHRKGFNSPNWRVPKID